MDKYYIAVLGTGETSRANVEALVEDYVYANGQDVAFVFQYTDKPSSAQIYVNQWAKDKVKDVIVFAPEDANHLGITSATIINEPHVNALAKFIEGKGSVFYLLNDSDTGSLMEAVELSERYGLPVYDLCNGLVSIGIQAKTIKVEEEEKPSEDPTAPLAGDDTYLPILNRLIEEGYLAPRRPQA